LSLGEPIYERKSASFNATYRLVTSLSTILKASGLWRPVPGTNYNAWKKSMMAGPFNPRGNAGLEVLPGDDAPVFLCGDDTPQLPAARVQGGVPLAFGVIGGGIALAALAQRPDILKLLPKPDAKNSWMMFENNVKFEEIPEIAELKPLPQGFQRAGFA